MKQRPKTMREIIMLKEQARVLSDEKIKTLEDDEFLDKLKRIDFEFLSKVGDEENKD